MELAGPVADVGCELGIDVVRVVGVLAKWVDEEEDRRDFALGELGGDLRVTAERTGEHPCDVEADFLGNETASCACADEMVALKDGFMAQGEGERQRCGCGESLLGQWPQLGSCDAAGYHERPDGYAREQRIPRSSGNR